MITVERIEEYQSKWSAKDVEFSELELKMNKGNFFLAYNGRLQELNDFAVDDILEKTAYNGKKLNKTSAEFMESVQPGSVERLFNDYKKDCCKRERTVRLINYKDEIMGVKSQRYSVMEPLKQYEWFVQNFGEPNVSLDKMLVRFSTKDMEVTQEMRNILRKYGVGEKEFAVGVELIDSICGFTQTTVSDILVRLKCTNGMVGKVKDSLRAKHIGKLMRNCQLFDTEQNFSLEYKSSLESTLKYLSNDKQVEDAAALAVKHFNKGNHWKNADVIQTAEKYSTEINEFTGNPGGQSLWTIVQTLTDKYLNDPLTPIVKLGNQRKAFNL